MAQQPDAKDGEPRVCADDHCGRDELQEVVERWQPCEVAQSQVLESDTFALTSLDVMQQAGQMTSHSLSCRSKSRLPSDVGTPAQLQDLVAGARELCFQTLHLRGCLHRVVHGRSNLAAGLSLERLRQMVFLSLHCPYLVILLGDGAPQLKVLSLVGTLALPKCLDALVCSFKGLYKLLHSAIEAIYPCLNFRPLPRHVLESLNLFCVLHNFRGLGCKGAVSIGQSSLKMSNLPDVLFALLLFGRSLAGLVSIRERCFEVSHSLPVAVEFQLSRAIPRHQFF
mmetsp:Transcript_56216/g.150125  ORF Transcript_56216/g.150125 Transcript_56216/m.150125 type:complete len:282 (+) Transcript_56216:173-1018(+)